MKRLDDAGTAVKVFVVIMFVAALLPRAWSGDLLFDKAEFTTTWYKTWIDSWKIVIAFWLANVFWVRLTKFRESQEVAEATARVSRRWRQEKTALRNALGQLSDVNRLSADAMPNLRRQIDDKALALYVFCQTALTTMPLEELEDTGTEMLRYQQELYACARQLADSIREGKIAFRRSLDASDSEALDELVRGLGE
ncbi:MAG TPA: hypothetical protein PLN42_08365 [Anaerolineae bacterium]|nr:hypothetical protein [Anaerolineae bacterium]